MSTLENRRAGRETELRKKMLATVARFEDVFKKALTPVLLRQFLDAEEVRNRHNFLRDRLGELSDTDIGYLRNVLKENVVDDTRTLKVDTEEIDENLVDVESEDDFNDLA